MIPWADSHNHLQDARLGAAGPLVRAMREAGVTACVANATQEADWPDVARLAREFPGFVAPAFGVHPWRAATVLPGWQERLADLLEEFPTASLGECGLDGWVDSPSLPAQEAVFMDQLRLGKRLNRPLTIHCLKAWNPLFDAFKKEAPPGKFLMHSFGGSAEIAARLAREGAYFSFSGYFLQPRKAAVLAVFRGIPLDRLLVETDAPDMLPPGSAIRHPLPGGHNHPANLPAIAEGLAAALGISAAELSAHTLANHRSLFGHT
jgi:TatD DNase family protein